MFQMFELPLFLKNSQNMGYFIEMSHTEIYYYTGLDAYVSTSLFSTLDSRSNKTVRILYEVRLDL